MNVTTTSGTTPLPVATTGVVCARCKRPLAMVGPSTVAFAHNGIGAVVTGSDVTVHLRCPRSRGDGSRCGGITEVRPLPIH